MTEDDRAFTHRWWTEVCADEARLVRFLQKLWLTEYEGYADNYGAARKWGGDNQAVVNIFHRTGDDEAQHAELLRAILTQRNAFPPEPWPPESDYWKEMEAEIDSLEACAAVFHLGEKLAAERFEVMWAHPDTPDDVMHFLEEALPDERHHARVFLKLTTPEVLARIETAHAAAVARLKGVK